MCGGGSSSYTPPTEHIPWEQTEAGRKWRQDEDARIEGEKKAAEAAKEQATLAKFNTDVESAVTGARSGAKSRVEQLGLNFDEFASPIDAEISRIRSGIPNKFETPSTYFTPDLADTILGREQEGRRTRYGRELDNIFTPGFESQAFSDTADDSIISAILGEQQRDAEQYLKRAGDRGVLTGSGLSASMTELAKRRPGAETTLQGIGGNVLNKYRGELADLSEDARGSAASYKLGSPLDTSSFGTRKTNKISELTGRLEGDIRNQQGGAPLFDIEELLQRGTSEQGAQNTQGGILDAIAERQSKRNKTRGIGSQGAF